jgi:hypothetical protein
MLLLGTLAFILVHLALFKLSRSAELDETFALFFALPGLFVGNREELQTRPVAWHRLKHLLKEGDRLSHFRIHVSHTLYSLILV